MTSLIAWKELDFFLQTTECFLYVSTWCLENFHQKNENHAGIN